MVKKKYVLFILIILIIIFIFINLFKKNKVVDNNFEDVISLINENYYNIELNFEENRASVDGKEIKLTKLFNISDNDLNDIISNNQFEDFVQENIIGDIEYINGKISVTNPYSTNTLIVKAKDESVFEKYKDIIEINEVVEDFFVISFKNAIDTKNGYEDLKKDKEIFDIVKNYKVYKMDSKVAVRGVESENLAWGVESTGLGHYSSKVNYGEKNDVVKIAVLDTGINASHEVFSANSIADKIDFTYSYDYVNDDLDVSDDDGHGTAVAGVIAESTSENIIIVPVKVMDENGEGYFSDIFQAIEDIYMNVDIINLSLGANISEISEENMETLEDFFKKIYDNGTIVVCAAGNESSAVAYPGASKYTLSASATDVNGNFAESFSNYGDEVDFAMPGVNLKLPDYTENKSYKPFYGTSFSCPFLASAIALVKADYNYSQIADILNVLKENAEDKGDIGKDAYYGYGIINFDSNMFEKPVIVDILALDETWSLENRILVKAVSGKKIESYAITLNDELPVDWINFDSQVTSMEMQLSTSTNGINNVWIKDVDGNIANGKVDIKYVDNIKPVITKFELNESTISSLNINLLVQDEYSGISNIKWYYKKSVDEQFIEMDENFEMMEKNIINKFHMFEDLECNMEYNIYAMITDAVGNSINTEIITVSTLKKTGIVSIENKTQGLAKVKIESIESNKDFSINTDEEEFRIICDVPCVVVLEDNTEVDNNCIRIDGIVDDNNVNEYRFFYDFNDNDDLKFIIALKGDVNFNGVVNAADSMIINRSLLLNYDSAYFELSLIQNIIADIDRNGVVDILDSELIDRSRLSEKLDNYLELEW